MNQRPKPPPSRRTQRILHVSPMQRPPNAARGPSARALCSDALQMKQTHMTNGSLPRSQPHDIGVGRTPRSRISRCLLSQKWRDRKGSENRSPLRNHAISRSHRALRFGCARQHWAFEPTIVLHEKRSRQGGRKRSQESGALANSSCEDHFNLSPQIYSWLTFQPPAPIESTSVQHCVCHC